MITVKNDCALLHAGVLKLQSSFKSTTVARANSRLPVACSFQKQVSAGSTETIQLCKALYSFSREEALVG